MLINIVMTSNQLGAVNDRACDGPKIFLEQNTWRDIQFLSQTVNPVFSHLFYIGIYYWLCVRTLREDGDIVLKVLCFYQNIYVCHLSKGS